MKSTRDSSTIILPCRGRGFMLLGLLVFLMLAGASLATFTQAAAYQRQREAENELLWIGQQYRHAIESYHRASPGPTKQLPTQLADLLRDPRFPQPVHHIRKLYADPLAPDRPWGIVRLQGDIVGVYSQADGEPFRKSGFDTGLGFFGGARSYSDWRFLWVPGRQATAAPPKPLDPPTRPRPSANPPLPSPL